MNEHSGLATSGAINSTDRFKSLSILVLLCLIISIITTKWIGDITLYQEFLEVKRLMLHEAVLKNQPPEGKTWNDFGANSINKRVATVWVAEKVHEITKVAVLKVYRLIDILSLFLTLLIIFYYLRQWHDSYDSMTGLLLVGVLLPLTMFFALFHPWDRPSHLLWSAMLLAITRNKFIVFALLYILSIIIKFDSLFAFGLVFFIFISRETWLRSTLLTLGYLAVGLLVYYFLSIAVPGGKEPRAGLIPAVIHNLNQALSFNINYPPFLTHGLSILLGVYGWRSACPLIRRLWLFGIFLLVPYFVLVNFEEVRTQVATVFSMLPLALNGLSTVCRDRNQSSRDDKFDPSHHHYSQTQHRDANSL